MPAKKLTIALLTIFQLHGCGGGSSAGGSSDGEAERSLIVDAGDDFVFEEGESRRLSGAVLSEGVQVNSISWVQLSGTTSVLSDSSTLYPDLTIPWYGNDDENELTYQLRVVSSDNVVATDTVKVTVQPKIRSSVVVEGYSFFTEFDMKGNVDFVELRVSPDEPIDITLRSFLGGSTIKAYDSFPLSDAELLGSGQGSDIQKQTIRLQPTGNDRIYIEVEGGNAYQYTFTARVPSDFLEDGFPVDVVVNAGDHQGGPESRAVSVGNINATPELEILYSTTSQGPLYAYDYQGNNLLGWPINFTGRVAYPSLGELDGDSSSLEIVSGFGPFFSSCANDLYIINGSGGIAPGWPLSSCNAGNTVPPVLFDMDNDGVDEIFNIRGRGYYASGLPITLFDQIADRDSYGQPAIGDVDGDGSLDFVFEKFSEFNEIAAFDINGNVLSGFPIKVDLKPLNTIIGGPVGLADLDGQNGKEIVSIRRVQNIFGYYIIQVFDGSNGQMLWENSTEDFSHVTATPSFGDITGDGLPEVLIQDDSKIYAWTASGEAVPNFPLSYTDNSFNDAGASSPLIADVTGDQNPNIVVVSSKYIKVFSATGVLEHQIRVQFNNVLPAIADIDLDGRNEIIFGESAWKGIGNERVAGVWVFDLGGTNHGEVQWGQLGGSYRRHFSYDGS